MRMGKGEECEEHFQNIKQTSCICFPFMAAIHVYTIKFSTPVISVFAPLLSSLHDRQCFPITCRYYDIFKYCSSRYYDISKYCSSRPCIRQYFRYNLSRWFEEIVCPFIKISQLLQKMAVENCLEHHQSQKQIMYNSVVFHPRLPKLVSF